MELRFKLPFDAFIIGPSEASLKLSTLFQYGRFSIVASIEGEAPSTLENVPPEVSHCKKATSISFLLQELGSEASILLQICNDTSKHPELLKLINKIANRVLLNIRNFGYVTGIQQHKPKDEETKNYFAHWQVEICEDGANWHSILPKHAPFEDIVLALIPLPGNPTAELKTTHWIDIEEAVQDNLEAPPEREFFTNAIEHIRTRNYRLALLESIICLEIVLGQFLKAHLTLEKSIPKNRVDEFVSPKLGLADRVSVVLQLILHPDYISAIDWNKVLVAIKWRNEIIHRTGHLPPDANEETLTAGIFSVLGLAQILAQQRDQIHASKDLQELAKTISKDNGVPVPNIVVVSKHRIVMQFMYFSSENFPDDAKINLLVADVSRRLATRDSRFSQDEHLFIRFLIFPNTLRAMWHKGRLEHPE